MLERNVVPSNGDHPHLDSTSSRRTPGRYTRYADEYGYDLSLVKPVLVDGYLAYAEYKSNRSKPEDQALGKIAQALSQHMQFDEFDELRTFEADLPKADGLDQVLASLE